MIVAPLIATLIFPATLVLDPIRYDTGRLWMLLPLALAIAVVYKSTKVPDMRQMPVAALFLWVTIVAGMLGVGVALYVITWLFL